VATPIDPFSNFLPVRIRFGDGVVDELAGILEDAGVRRPFILLDPVLDGLPSLMPALDAVAAQSDEIVGYPLEPGEPTFETIDAAAEALARSNADAVVAIGGGSALDTAKGARLVANQGGPFARFVGGEVPIEAPRLPLVTIPTTSGTGSEVTGGIVAIDPSRNAKFGVAGPNNRAQHALVDPVLTHELPDKPTLYGGADALAQAISPVAAITRTPIGDGVGLEARGSPPAPCLPLSLTRPTPARARRWPARACSPDWR
jgi:alcohol dehydrogenase class IV